MTDILPEIIKRLEAGFNEHWQKSKAIDEKDYMDKSWEQGVTRGLQEAILIILKLKNEANL